MLSLWSAIGCLIVGNLIVSYCHAAPRRLSALSLVVSTPMLALAFFVEGVPVEKSLTGMGSILLFVRTVDLVRDPKRRSYAFNAWFLASPFDARHVTFRGPRLELRPFVIALIDAVIFFSCLALLEWLARPAHEAGWALRWLVGAVTVYTMVDCAAKLVRGTYRLVGFEMKEMHDAPVLSRSVQEFWGNRWNRPVHELLGKYFFTPLARRRGITAAVMASFVVSGLLHFYIAIVAVDLRLSTMMGVFFVVQGFIVLLERRLRVARWNATSGRVWTIGWMALTCPLFVEPFLKAFRL